MKVGIVTIYKGNNYGAFFQAYSLKEYLQKEGHEVYFLKHGARNINVLCLRALVKKLLRLELKGYGYQFEKRNKFIEAVKCFNECDVENAKTLDVVIFGSDEIWNVKRKKINKYPIFFGCGIDNEYMISYAPSINKAEIADFTSRKSYVDGLKRMNRISVRDVHSENVIKELLKREDVTIVVDPTLLQEKKFYLERMQKVDISEEYILIYSYGTDLNVKIIAEIVDYAETRNLKLVSILEHFDWCHYNIVPSPFEMLAYFNNATSVITDTFHGTIFSIIFNKKFVSVVKEQNKVWNLLSAYGLQDRVCDGSLTRMNYILEQEIIYSKVNEALESARKKSAFFLEEALEKTTNKA